MLFDYVMYILNVIRYLICYLYFACLVLEKDLINKKNDFVLLIEGVYYYFKKKICFKSKKISCTTLLTFRILGEMKGHGATSERLI